MTRSPEDLRAEAARQERLAVETIKDARCSAAHMQRARELRLAAIQAEFAAFVDETPPDLMDGAAVL